MSNERIFGRFRCVSTSTTPGTASAACVSIATMRPFAAGELTTTPYARSGAGSSAAYFAWPVTLARPSTRDTGVPVRTLPVPRSATGGFNASISSVIVLSP